MNSASESVRDSAASSQGPESGFMWDEPLDAPSSYILTAPQLAPAAYYGILKWIVDEACRHSEAVPSSVALNVLARFAATVGRIPHMQISDELRYLNFNALIVGPTAKGRKGTSAHMPARLFRLVEQRGMWAPLQELTALSTGEGLIHRVRDPRYNDEDGKCIDRGVADKRLLCEISEFASVLAVAERKDATISMVVRDAFDSKTLTTPTKTSFNRATGAHVVIVGSITEGELVQKLAQVEIVNGLANRFMMAYAARTKLVSNPLPTDPRAMDWFADQIAEAVRIAVSQGDVPMDDDAKEYWDATYTTLNEAQHEANVAKLIAREELYTRLLATLIALLNREAVVTTLHLDAALAWRQYWEDTLNFVFSNSKKNDDTKALNILKDTIVQTIGALGGKRVPHTAVVKRMTNNWSKTSAIKTDHVKKGLELLQREAPPRIIAETEETDGRPKNMYTLAYLKN